MSLFKFSVDNGHYPKGSLVELPEETAKLFEKLKFGLIQKEKKPSSTVKIKKTK